MVRLFFRYICCMVRRLRNMVCDMVHMLFFCTVGVFVLSVRVRMVSALLLIVITVMRVVRAVARLLLVVIAVMGAVRAVARLFLVVIAVV